VSAWIPIEVRRCELAFKEMGYCTPELRERKLEACSVRPGHSPAVPGTVRPFLLQAMGGRAQVRDGTDSGRENIQRVSMPPECGRPSSVPSTVSNRSRAR
jgi:hypothetical protein